MIRKTLEHTKAATFSIDLPNKNHHDMPTPAGTGFFVSPDGWFITAAHVITENGQSDGPVRRDIEKVFLKKELRFPSAVPIMCQAISFGHIIPRFDFALLKVDFKVNADKAWLAGRTEFPFLGVSRRQLDEGEPVYSFGYPLSDAFSHKTDMSVIGSVSLKPRVTSAIVSSTINQTRMLMSPNDPKVYLLDKALNYGNSGGPIVSIEKGRVHALCSSFQPVFVPQQHIHDEKGNMLSVMIPSLYGIVSSLGNPDILSLLGNLNIHVFDD